MLKCHATPLKRPVPSCVSVDLESRRPGLLFLSCFSQCLVFPPISPTVPPSGHQCNCIRIPLKYLLSNNSGKSAQSVSSYSPTWRCAGSWTVFSPAAETAGASPGCWAARRIKRGKALSGWGPVCPLGPGSPFGPERLTAKKAQRVPEEKNTEVKRMGKV